jgi:amidophosphoribosyltransferase
MVSRDRRIRGPKHETICMCGIIGIIGKETAINSIYPALIALQHRGQDAAGAATFEQGFHVKKGMGLVTNVFSAKHLQRLRGQVGIGHVRYPTVGSGAAEDAQPFIATTPFGIALAHNGNIVNYFTLREELTDKEFRYLDSQCDAEVILNLLSVELMKNRPLDFRSDTLFRALRRVYRRLTGSYAVVAVIANKGLLAFRDTRGIKPLVIGKSRTCMGFASESVALDLLGCRDIIDVEPGEAYFIDMQGTVHHKQIVKPTRGSRAACIFEYVYFARPDSVIDGIGVYDARLRLGAELGAECVKQRLAPDVVIPVPDTARGSAQIVAEKLGIKYREGLIKNRYIHRTFIMPTQEERMAAVRLKLNPIRSVIQGKDILLVDDSIVRGNTAREIIGLVRAAGARSVMYAAYAPPLRYPCVYGIDMQTRGEFIAQEKSIEEIRTAIGADRLIYQTADGLVRAVEVEKKGFCTACFTGEYPTEVPSRLMEQIERDRMRCQTESRVP